MLTFTRNLIMVNGEFARQEMELRKHKNSKLKHKNKRIQTNSKMECRIQTNQKLPSKSKAAHKCKTRETRI